MASCWCLNAQILKDFELLRVSFEYIFDLFLFGQYILILQAKSKFDNVSADVNKSVENNIASKYTKTPL